MINIEVGNITFKLFFFNYAFFFSCLRFNWNVGSTNHRLCSCNSISSLEILTLNWIFSHKDCNEIIMVWMIITRKCVLVSLVPGSAVCDRVALLLPAGWEKRQKTFVFFYSLLFHITMFTWTGNKGEVVASGEAKPRVGLISCLCLHITFRFYPKAVTINLCLSLGWIYFLTIFTFYPNF